VVRTNQNPVRDISANRSTIVVLLVCRYRFCNRSRYTKEVGDPFHNVLSTDMAWSGRQRLEMAALDCLRWRDLGSSVRVEFRPSARNNCLHSGECRQCLNIADQSALMAAMSAASSSWAFFALNCCHRAASFFMLDLILSSAAF
jgi:hypothetical protein